MLGIDITSTQNQYKNRGIGLFTREVVERFIEEKKSDIVLFGYKGETTIKNIKKVRLHEIYHNILLLNPITKIQNSYLLDLAVKKENLSKFFSPFIHSGVPYSNTYETYVFIHDLIQKELNNYSAKGMFVNTLKSLHYNNDWRKARKSKVILTNSNTSKSYIEKYIRKDNIIVSYLGVDHNVFNTNDEVKKDSQNSPYILYFGGNEKNKNVDLVVESFLKFKKTNKSNIKLVLICKDTDEIIKKFGDDPDCSSIQLMGFIDEKQKPSIIRNAFVYINLSKYEGFGLSVLEVVSSGVPVILSDIDIYKELFENVGVFVSLENRNKCIEEVSIALKKLITDPAYRETHIQEGIKRASEFNWNITYNIISNTILSK